MKGSMLLKLNETLSGINQPNKTIKCIKLNSKTVDELPDAKLNYYDNREKFAFSVLIQGVPIVEDDTISENEMKIEFKSDKNDITNKLDDVLKRLTIKESHKLSMKRVLEDNLQYYNQIERSDLCESVKKELKNINAENEFIYDLIVDIEKIKNMIDEI